MRESNNPFSPGAGTPPPELAGRAAILDRSQTIFERTLSGFFNQGLLLIGLRGVGKTVLLGLIAQNAEALNLQLVQIEAPEGKRIAELIAPELRRVLLKMNIGANVAEKSRRALQALKNFVGSLKISICDFEVTIEPEPGLADSGDLDSDLTALLLAIGDAARENKTAVVLLIDEMQYLQEVDLAALIVAMHKVAQKKLPVILIGAGLPQLVGNAGKSKSYAERLFEYPPVGALSFEDAQAAIQKPFRAANCELTFAAMQTLYKLTQGYPFFMQAWAYSVWNAASVCPVEEAVVLEVTNEVIQLLDRSFFRVRFDRLTPREKDYVFSMATLGEGPHRSGDIADSLGRTMTSLAPLRSSLIKKGMIYSPAHGDTAFTVPLFDEFLKRTMG